MTMRFAAPAISLSLFLAVAPAHAEQPAKTGDPVIDRTVSLVEERFFDTDALPSFRTELGTIRAEAAAGDAPTLDVAVDRLLASLGASHTARYTPDEVSYYELADVFRFAFRRDGDRLFPPDGEIAYEGIGMVTAEIDGKTFVTDVYDDGVANNAGLSVGDEIVSADASPFAQIGSFKGKVGETVTLAVRKAAGSEPVDIAVKPERIEPMPSFLKAIEGSVRTVERDGHTIGVVRLWTYTSDRVGALLTQLIASDPLKDVDGLVLDLRSRWGGAPADAAEMFLGRTADMTMTSRGEEPRQINARWRKPIVAVIDEGTRSGMEILAYSLKQNGIPLVGTNTAADVVAGTGFLLPDDSFLILAVADVHVDGKRLEGTGVAPDIAVPFDIRYAGGADPQMERAIAEMADRLAAELN